MFIRTAASTTVLLAALCSAGCQFTGPSTLRYEDGPYFYQSYEMAPKTVTLIDLRNGEELFVMDIPAGKKLSVQFVEGAGSDPVYAPDLMKWDVWNIDDAASGHRNAMSVPAARSRRLDWAIRPGVEYRSTPPELATRADLVEDPEFWTPDEGGVLGASAHGERNYDD